MRHILTCILLVVTYLFGCLFLWELNNEKDKTRRLENEIDSLTLETFYFHENKETMVISDWEVFIEALIWVESRGDETVVGTKNDVGVLQITPIFIAEANAIIGRKGYYKHEDAYDRETSIEIFNVVNSFHNKEKSFIVACKLHNRNAGQPYLDKVLRKYEQLRW